MYSDSKIPNTLSIHMFFNIKIYQRFVKILLQSFFLFQINVMTMTPKDVLPRKRKWGLEGKEGEVVWDCSALEDDLGPAALGAGSPEPVLWSTVQSPSQAARAAGVRGGWISLRSSKSEAFLRKVRRRRTWLGPTLGPCSAALSVLCGGNPAWDQLAVGTRTGSDNRCNRQQRDNSPYRNKRNAFWNKGECWSRYEREFYLSSTVICVLRISAIALPLSPFVKTGRYENIQRAQLTFTFYRCWIHFHQNIKIFTQ